MSNEHDRQTQDERVSAVYRDLADERTPADLDRAVLREAACANRTRYGILRSWVRPLAWAAMIGLSLVIVLEFSRLPGGDEMPAAEQLPEIGGARAGDTTTDPGTKSEADGAISAAPADKPVESLELREEPAGLRKLAPAPAPDAAEGRRQAATLAPVLDESAADSTCAEAEAEGPEAWYGCILDLIERGEFELAEKERARLRDAYPDFASDNADR